MNSQTKKLNRSAVINEKHLSLTEYCNLLKSKYRLNKRVLLIQIPQLILKSFNPEVARKKGYYIFPPTGLQYLYEAIKERDMDVKILDLNFELLKRVWNNHDFNHQEWLTILDDYLKKYDPSIVGVSCMYDLGIQPLFKTLTFLKENGSRIVITGGVIPTYEWQKLLSKDLCHFVVKGEGEDKINYLFDQLTNQNINTKPCSGICYKQNGDYFQTEGIDRTANINTDLIKSYSLINIKEYFNYGSLNPFSRIAGLKDYAFAPIQMSRGCRAVCTFCSVRDFMGKGVRKRSVDKVLAEMEFLVNKCGVKHFEWLDDDLLFYRKDFQELLSKIIVNKWNITWSANNGVVAASIDSETMRLIRDSGCIGFKIGIETGNSDKLKEIKKPATLDTFRNAAKIFQDYPEVFVGGNFMIGFPYEKFHQMLDSFRFYLELNLDWGAFTMCQAIRGATAFSEFEDHFENQLSSYGESVRNFIPTRESSKGQLATKENVVKGLDIFKLDPQCQPSSEQIKEIWFTFNLIGNYINNKNLRPCGRPEKFIAWVEMAQVAYPTNAYMSLFLGLAYMVKGQKREAFDYYSKAIECNKTEYWKERLSLFGLNEVLNDFPKKSKDVYDIMDRLDMCYSANILMDK